MCTHQTQIIQQMRTVWSVFVVHIRNFASLAIQNATSEDSDQIAGWSQSLLGSHL